MKISNDRWANFWFLNGGGVHSAWKRHHYTAIKEYALQLPKAAWDEQQKEIDKLQSQLKIAREALGRVKCGTGKKRDPNDNRPPCCIARQALTKIGEGGGE